MSKIHGINHPFAGASLSPGAGRGGERRVELPREDLEDLTFSLVKGNKSHFKQAGGPFPFVGCKSAMFSLAVFPSVAEISFSPTSPAPV